MIVATNTVAAEVKLMVDHVLPGWAAPAARLVFASLFLLAGLNKLLDPAAAEAMLAGVGLRPVQVFSVATAAFEIGAGAALALGRRPAAVAGVMLAAFTLLTNVLFHRFWEMDGALARLELSLFFKNVAIAGGLTYVAVREWERVRR
jgi:putative oxidoreductase